MQLILVLILSSIFVFVIAGWEDQVKQLYANAIDSIALLLPNCPLPMRQPQVVVSIFTQYPDLIDMIQPTTSWLPIAV